MVYDIVECRLDCFV